MRPRRTLLTLLLFVLLFYVLPVQAVIRRACPPLAFSVPTFGLVGLPPALEIEVNARYVLALLAAYLGLFLLVALTLRLFRAYHWEGALVSLAKVTTVKDLVGMDRLLISVAAVAISALNSPRFSLSDSGNIFEQASSMPYKPIRQSIWSIF